MATLNQSNSNASAAERFPARLLSEATALGAGAARLRPVGRRPREGAVGAHGRRRAGPGASFWQYRAYTAGESARLIDWRRSARGEHPIVREREWEAALTLDLWIDSSKSMSYPEAGGADQKQHAADLLGLAAAAAWLKNGERIRALGDPRASGAAKIGGLAAALGRAAAAASSDAEAGLPPRTRPSRHGFTLLIGDFLSAPGDIIDRAEKLAGAGARGAAVQILHADEAMLNFDGRIDFQSLESAETHLLRHVPTGRPRYAARMEDHRKALAHGFNRIGWSFMQHQTDQPVGPVLTAALASLAAGR